MLTFHLLGPLDLRTAEGVEVRSVLAQPRRVALLAYLALRGGYVRRDTLLALFWPESDTEHARGALRNALHYLRRSLGEGVIVSRGDEEVGIAPERLRCDAREFVRLLEAGSLAEALDLYRGDLLEGFFISGAPEFEQWLEEERAQLKQRAARAARQLAETAAGAGESERTVRLVRQAVVLSREEEPAVRELLALPSRSEDGSGPASVEREGASVEREPGTEELAEEALRSQHAAPRPESPSWRVATRPFRAGSQRLLLLLGLLVLLAGGAVLGWRNTSSAVPVSTHTIAVLPFAYSGGGEHAYLAEGLARLLSTNLNGAGELRSIDPRALFNALAEEPRAELDYRRGRRMAEQFGAGLYVLGHIVEAGGRLRITAVVYDRSTARPELPTREVSVEGSAEQLFALVDELTAKLLANSGVEPQTQLTRLAARTTQSLPAVQAYLEGEREYHAGRYAAAMDLFARAVQADTAFALAYYRLSIASTWVNPLPLAHRGAQLAVRHAHRLSEPDRLLVLAWHGYQTGAPQEAERLYRELLARQPDHVEAWFQLGEVQYHWGPALGRPATEAREAFEKVLAYEPQNVGALIHLARIAALERKEGELDSLVYRIATLGPDDNQLLQMRALQAFVNADTAAQAEMAVQLAYTKETELRNAVLGIAMYSGNLAAVTERARPLLLSDELDTRVQAQGHLLLAQLELSRGRWGVAKRELAALAAAEPGLATEFRTAYSIFPFLRLSREDLEAASDAIARVQPTHSMSPVSPASVFELRRYFLLGSLAVRLGNGARARAQLPAMAHYLGIPDDSSFAREFMHELRAQLAWAAGAPEEALAQLGEPRVQANGALPQSWSYPKAHERWLRAELLRTLGRDAEALRVYASFPDPTGYDLIYLAPSHLRRAQLHERRGEREQAAEHYRRFLELWRDADPELQPLVAQARRKLDDG